MRLKADSTKTHTHILILYSMCHFNNLHDFLHAFKVFEGKRYIGPEIDVWVSGSHLWQMLKFIVKLQCRFVCRFDVPTEY